MRVFLQDFALVSTSAHGNIRENTIEVSGYANVVPDGAGAREKATPIFGQIATCSVAPGIRYKICQFDLALGD